MVRTGRRLAPALAAIAVAALLAACAEPDLTVGVPNTTTTAPLPSRVTEPPEAPDTPPPAPDGEVAGTAAQGETTPGQATEPSEQGDPSLPLPVSARALA